MAHFPAHGHEVNWHGIMDGGADTGLLQVLDESIALVSLDDKSVIDTELTRAISGALKPCATL